MYLQILQNGHPVLRQRARALTVEQIKQSDTQQLIQLMQDTMYEAPGVGLAAPQIGVDLQIIVIEDKKEYTAGATEEQLKARDRQPVPFHVLINPKLIVEDETPATFYEGCLSVEGFVGEVPRALGVKVEALDQHGEPVIIQAKGWYARILQHEIDHLQGTLCIDRMNMRTFATLDNYARFILHHR